MVIFLISVLEITAFQNNFNMLMALKVLLDGCYNYIVVTTFREKFLKYVKIDKLTCQCYNTFFFVSDNLDKKIA